MLPDIKQRITSQLQKFNAKLQSLGGPLGDSNSSSIVLSIDTDQAVTQEQGCKRTTKMTLDGKALINCGVATHRTRPRGRAHERMHECKRQARGQM